MTDFIHTGMNKKFHGLEKILIKLGYSGIDDYTTMIHSSNITVSNDLQSLFADLSPDSHTATAIQCFRSIQMLLKEHKVPYHMVHKTKGNYLQLVPIKHDLSTYIELKRANIVPDSDEVDVKDLKDFKYESYLEGLRANSSQILHNDQFRDIDWLARNPKTLSMVSVHGKSWCSTFTIYPLKRQIIMPVLRREDAMYNMKIYLCNDDREILQIVHNPEIDVGGVRYRADTLRDAFYILLASCSAAVIVIDANTAVLESPTLRSTMVYDAVYINSQDRQYLHKVNEIIPMYNTNITYPELGQQRVTVHADEYNVRHTGNLYDFKVHGNHKLTVTIGGQIVPVVTRYFPNTDTTDILDFTKVSPFYSLLSQYHAFSIKRHQHALPDKRMTIDYCVDADTAETVDGVAGYRSTTTFYDDRGTYLLEYKNGQVVQAVLCSHVKRLT